MKNSINDLKNNEGFEKYIMELSKGCADLEKNLYGEYQDPTVLKIWYEYINKKDS